MKGRDTWDRVFDGPPVAPGMEESAWLDAYMPYLRRKRAGKALDLGCGSGVHTRRLFGEGFQVTACDFSPAALRRVEAACPAAHTVCFDMTKAWPESIREMDIILASLSTHYFPWADTRAVYRRIHDALAPGGYYIFRVNSMAEYHLMDRAHAVRAIERGYYLLDDGTAKRYFDRETLARVLAPFRVLDVREGSGMYFGRGKHYWEGIAGRED